MLNDIRYAWRTLRKTPVFTAVAVLSLAIGIGVNVATFSCLNALVFRPAAGINDPDRIAYLHQWMGGIAYREFEYLRDHNNSCEQLAGSAPCRGEVRLVYQQQTEFPALMLVSSNYFSVLGAQISPGRTFLTDEDKTAGTNPVIILSHRFWRLRFNSDPNLVGSAVSLNGTAYTVIGIAPADFPREPGALFTPEAWVPMAMRGVLDPEQDQLRPNDGSAHGVQFYGRLKPGTTISQAKADIGLLDEQFAKTWFDPKDRRDLWAPYLQTGYAFLPWRREIAALMAVILFVVGMVLLIACANLANLLLARATTRQAEMSVRLALGASRARLIRQLLTESMLIAILGGALGLLVGTWASDVIWPGFIMSVLPTGWGENFNFSLDWRIFWYTLGITLATGVIFGLVPALEATRPNIHAGLKQESTFGEQRVSRSRLRNLLVVTQVAVSLSFLIGTSLLLRRLQTGVKHEFNFETESIVMLEFSSFSARPREFQRMLIEKIQSLPGVKSVACARVWYGQYFSSKSILVDGQPPDRSPTINQSKVTPAYFQTLRVPITRGRNFTEAEVLNNAPVAIVSETFAKQFWPNVNPIGHRIRVGSEAIDAEVIGVAKDGVREIRSQYELTPFVGDLYYPLTAADKPEVWIRAEGDPLAIVPTLRGEISRLDPDVRFGGRRLKDLAEQWIRPTALLASAVGVLGTLALLLASLGLYGVMSYSVSQRTREVGIRMALGARKGSILRMVIWNGMKLVAIGMLLGLIGSAALSYALRSMLYGLSALDPITFSGTSVILGLVALAACYFPARQATKVDPIVALRCE